MKSTGRALLNDAFEPLVTAAKGNGRALLRLAELARNQQKPERAFELAMQALKLGEGDPSQCHEAHDFIASMVPDWHWRMMRDEPRNRAFEEAIARAVTPESSVLDVGSGSGLLAMFAARAGARSVVSCEANPAIAAAARDIVALNGFGDRVTVLSRHSSELDAQADLGGRVDLVVSEIIGKELVDEFVLPSMRDATARLLKPGGRMIPAAADVRVALARWDGLDRQAVNRAGGFDVSPFNRLLPGRAYLMRDDEKLHLGGEAASLFSFDLMQTEPHAETAEITLVAAGGLVNGIVQWIGLQMDESEYFENRPDPQQTSSWSVQFFPLASPFEAAPGDSVRVAGSVFGNSLHIWKA